MIGKIVIFLNLMMIRMMVISIVLLIMGMSFMMRVQSTIERFAKLLITSINHVKVGLLPQNHVPICY